MTVISQGTPEKPAESLGDEGNEQPEKKATERMSKNPEPQSTIQPEKSPFTKDQMELFV